MEAGDGSVLMIAQKFLQTKKKIPISRYFLI